MTVTSRGRLGASLALTGPEASYAQQLQCALDLALVDTPGSPRPRIEDDESDPETARLVAQSLVESDVIAVIGPMNSWTCEVQAPLFAAAGLPHVTPSASNPALARQGWSTFFRACPSDDRQADALAAVACRLVGARRVAAVHDGTSFAEPLAQAFARRSRALGMAVVAVTSPTEGGPAAALADVVAGTPDAILIAGLETPCAAAARALRDLGTGAVFLGTDAVKPTHVLRTPGFPPPWLTNSATDAARQAPQLHARLVEALGRHDSVYTVETYDVMRHLASWLASHPDATRADAMAFLRIPFDGLAGRYAFDAAGERPDARVGVYCDEEQGLRYFGSDVEVLPA